MADTTDPATEALDLREEFPPVPTDAWEAVIKADLKGADYEKKLVWKTEEGIRVRPYYRSGDLSGLNTQLQAPPGAYPYLRGSGTQVWTMVEPGTEPPADAIRADRFHEQGATAVQELGYAIAQGVERIVELTGAGHSVDEAAKSLSFVFAIGSNYFFQIAKLRATRLLWSRAVGAFSPSAESSCLMKIHARTALANTSIYDPYTNLLRATTEAMAAVIGGCDSLEVRAVRFPDRLALNAQRILKEESHIDRVADPAGGSYYIEALTDALAREAWKIFQQIEAAGGYAKAQSLISDAIAQSRAAKEKAIASRRKVLVGVNNYPDVGETAGGGDLQVAGSLWRGAEVFERIRMRTEKHAAKTGRRPRILLLERGDLKMRQARSQFVMNLFGCGGFDISISDQYEGSDADLIVLCSSDPEYPALAAEVCPKVKQPVIVAGNPKEHIEALNAAGVQGYVHVLSNAVDTLTEWQNRLGIGAGQ
jgi:methylmalonyl-CoA mutase